VTEYSWYLFQIFENLFIFAVLELELGTLYFTIQVMPPALLFFRQGLTLTFAQADLPPK
jgi:hypothetical protein